MNLNRYSNLNLNDYGFSGLVRGNLVYRTENKELKTGMIEVKIENIKVLSEAKELPMPVFGEQEYPEEIRLKYRFIDLRRKEMHKNIELRSKTCQAKSSLIYYFIPLYT